MKRLVVFGTFAILGCSGPNDLQLDAASAPVSCKSISINGAAAEKVCYREVNGLAIFQDDIVLGTVASLEAGKPQGETRALINSAYALGYWAWKSPQIPYTIDPSLPNPQRIVAAVAEFGARSGIAWVPRTTQPDFVTFAHQDTGNCVSNVGRMGGQQWIRLTPQCSVANVIHEMGHAAGMWHEHCRLDRDQYINVNRQNIQPGLESNFDVNPSLSQNFGAYDYGSIMHYAYWAFSGNGQPTITKKDGSTTGFGDAQTLSAGDVAALQALFSMNAYALNLSTGAVNNVTGPFGGQNDQISQPQISFDIAASGSIEFAGITSDWAWFILDSQWKTAAHVIHFVGHFAPGTNQTGAAKIYVQVAYPTGMQGSVTVGPVQVTGLEAPSLNMYRSFNPKLVDLLLTLGWTEGLGAGWEWNAATPKVFAVYTYPWATPSVNCTAQLMRCRIPGTWRHFISVGNCGGATVEGPTGFACYAAEGNPPPNHYGIYRIYHVGTGARLSASGPQIVDVLKGGGWGFEGYHGVAVRNPL